MHPIKIQRIWSVCTRTILLLAVTVGGLSGCTREDYSGKTVLSFSYCANFRDNDLWTEICEDFEEKHPDVKIRRKWVPGDYGTKLRLELISDTAADILLMDDEIYPAYAVRGFLVDFKPYIMRQSDELERRIAQDIGWVDTPENYEPYFLPTALQSFRYNDLQAGLPWDGNSMLMFYNKDLFDEAGIPYPTEDWTWEEFREIAKKLTRDIDGDERIDQFGTVMVFSFMGIEPFLWAWGADVLNEDRTRAALHSERAIEAAQYMMDVWYTDHSSAFVGEIEGMSADVQLLTGTVGAMVAGSYMLSDLKAVKGGMRWDLAHMPYGPYGERATRVTWDGISVNNGISDEKKEIAWEFVKHVLSKDSQARFGIVSRGMPAVREFAEKYYPKDDTEVREEIVIESTEYGHLTPITPRYLEMRDVTTPIFDQLNLNKQTPEEVLPEAARLLDEVLKKQIERWGK
jgi:multiple sugar transport system substrate-binding protein